MKNCSQSKTFLRIQQLMEQVENITLALGTPLSKDDYYIEELGCPHVPAALPKGHAGVYFYEYQGNMLKIGKANEKSNARFASQHYGFSAPSTLAKYLCADNTFTELGVTKENVGMWMKSNLHRYNILVNNRDSRAATELIEAVMHYVFRPKYEGAIK